MSLRIQLVRRSDIRSSRRAASPWLSPTLLAAACKCTDHEVQNQIPQVFICELLAFLGCVSYEQAEQIIALRILCSILLAITNDLADETVDCCDVSFELTFQPDVQESLRLPQDWRRQSAVSNDALCRIERLTERVRLRTAELVQLQAECDGAN